MRPKQVVKREKNETEQWKHDNILSPQLTAWLKTERFHCIPSTTGEMLSDELTFEQTGMDLKWVEESNYGIIRF